MIELLKILLSLSLSGTLMILILLLCKPLYKNRFSRQWQYYIWLIVVARLLLPFTPETSLMGTVFHHIDNAVIQADSIPQPEQEPPTFSETDIANQGNTPDKQAGIGGGKHLGPDKPTLLNVLDMAAQNIVAICLLGWLFVAVILFIRKVTIYQSFVKYIKAGQSEISDFALWELVGKLVGQTGVKKTVGLYTNSLISSPLLIGFFRPCIMLPTAELSESDMQNTILHELTHYRRRDMFYKWLVQITVCLHWFNPLVYLMGREINQACELSCDEAVIKSLDAGGRRAYGDTLLNSLGMGGSYKSSVASVTLNENAELLKERLDAIMRFKKKSGIAITITLILTLLLATTANAIGVYASPKDTTGSVLKAENISPVTAKPITDGPNSAKVNGPYLAVDSCNIQYEDTPYKWPFILLNVTNLSDKVISDCEVGLLAYDKDGKPPELYWDAQNVDSSGDYGNVGFGPDGIDYGIVTGIKPNSPKSYQWSIEGCYESIAPGERIKTDGWHLFDGWWDQPNRIHKVRYLLACTKQITFEDGTVWDNPDYENWLTTYQGIEVAPDSLNSYY